MEDKRTEQHDLTPREKSAIFALAGGIIPDWITCFIAGHEKSTTDVQNQLGLKSNVSRWKHSNKVTKFYEECRERLNNYNQNETAPDNSNITDTNTGNNNTDSKHSKRGRKGGFIDYASPDNQTAKLNEIINTASNAGEALDALKVIISTQRADRDGAKEQKQVRAYLPKNCSSCLFYAKAKEKQG